MIRVISFLFFLVTSNLLFAQSNVLFTVEGNPVSVDEFKFIYEKSNKDADFSKSSLEEYLELYKKFKLKVTESKALGYDTVQSYLKELKGYRDQLASTYVEDRIIVGSLAEEVLERSEQDVAFSNIYVPAKKGSVDTVAAYKKIKSAQKALNGKNFDQVAAQYSSLKEPYIGYYSAFQIPGIYALENALYSTKVGEVSPIIRSDYGYHIIKVEDKRLSLGRMEVAHILARTSNVITSAQAKEKIDKIYEELEGGKEFTVLARQYSDDKETQQKGGFLGEMTVGKYENAFEEVVYSLKKDEQYSAPVETSRGWHIVKRVGQKSIYATDQELKVLNQRIKRDSRMESAQLEIVNQTKEADNFTFNNELYSGFVANLTPAFLETTWRPDYDNENNKSVLFSIGERKVTLKDFRNKLIQSKAFRYKNKKSMTPQKVASTLYGQYEKETILDYYTANLESKVPAFKTLMREYEEGILLFNISKDYVWDASSRDTSGLKSFYEGNKENYKYQARGKVQSYVLGSQDEKIIKKVTKLLPSKTTEEMVAKFQTLGLSATDNSKLLEESSFKKTYPNLALKQGTIQKIKGDEEGNTTINYVEEVLPVSIKPLNAIRGYVISDYQQELEKEWVSSLEKKYEIIVNQDVFKKLIK